MALDLFFGKTGRNWARRDLTSVPPSSDLQQSTSKAADIFNRAVAANPNIAVRQRGKGFVATKTWKW